MPGRVRLAALTNPAPQLAGRSAHLETSLGGGFGCCLCELWNYYKVADRRLPASHCHDLGVHGDGKPPVHKPGGRLLGHWETDHLTALYGAGLCVVQLLGFLTACGMMWLAALRNPTEVWVDQDTWRPALGGRGEHGWCESI